MPVSSVKMRLPRRKKNGPRRTQLHKMCQSSSISYKIEIVSSYIESRPRDALLAVDKSGMTPLHNLLAHLPHRDDIAALLIARAPEACGMRDEGGSTPLHHAARNADLVSAELLTRLLRYDPSLALDENRDGETPFGLYCASIEETARNAGFLGVIRSKTDPDNEIGEAYYGPTFGEICHGPLLEKAVPFVRAVAWGDPRTAPHRDSENYAGVWSKMLHTTLYAVERAASASGALRPARGGAANAKNVSSADAKRYRFLVRAMMNRTHPRQQQQSGEEQQQQAEEEQPQAALQQQGGEGNGAEQIQQQQQQQPTLPQIQQQLMQPHLGVNEDDEQQQEEQQEQQQEDPQEQQQQHQEDPLASIKHSLPASKVDIRGNLPLHVAAAIPFLNAAPGTKEMLALGLAPFVSLPNDGDEHALYPSLSADSKDENEDNNNGGTTSPKQRPAEGIIEALVRLHPKGASTRDAAGLLPFEIAERLGSGWIKGGVGSMLGANPKVLSGREGLSQGVMPRVLSKIGRDLEVGAMFAVLRERPEVLLLRRAAS